MAKVKEFTRTNARDIADKVREALGELAGELGVGISLGGSSFSPDMLTIRITMTPTDDSGERVVSSDTNKKADYKAMRDGIEYRAPHIIGSVWKFPSGIAVVTDVAFKNRTYPYILRFSDGKVRKCNAYSMREEVLTPTEDEFRVWFTKDVEDDSITPSEEITWDKVNEYMEFKYNEAVYDACCAVFERGVADTFWRDAYDTIFCKELTDDRIVRALYSLA